MTRAPQSEARRQHLHGPLVPLDASLSRCSRTRLAWAVALLALTLLAGALLGAARANENGEATARSARPATPRHLAASANPAAATPPALPLPKE